MPRGENKFMVTVQVRGQVVSSPCMCQGILLEGRIERGIFLDGTAEQKIYNVARTIKGRAFIVHLFTQSA